MNRNLEQVKISGIRKFYNEVSKVEGAISLTLGQPDFNVPDKIKQAMIDAINENKTVYTANSGIEELKKEIAIYLKKIGVEYATEDICVTVGGSEALYTVMSSLLNEKDKLLIPSIAYPAYESIGKILGAEIITYDLNDDLSLNIEDIKKKVEDGINVLVLSYPSNPTGAILSKEERDLLYNIIKENDLIVITDEIYASLCFEQYYSVAQYKDILDKIIYVSGFSKMFSMTGLRLGYVCAKEQYMKEIMKIHQYNVSSAPSIVQWGALEGLRSCLSEVEEMKISFEERKDFCLKKLRDMGLEVNNPKGAFYIFPSIKKYNMTSEEFCRKLLNDKKVAIVPGSAFGHGGEGYIRISYCYSKEELEECLNKLEEFINELDK